MDIPVDRVGRKEHVFMFLEDNMSLGYCLHTEMFYQKPRHNFLCIWSVNIYGDDRLFGGRGVEVHRQRLQAREKIWARIS